MVPLVNHTCAHLFRAQVSTTTLCFDVLVRIKVPLMVVPATTVV